jgi:hypothetical protein
MKVSLLFRLLEAHIEDWYMPSKNNAFGVIFSQTNGPLGVVSLSLYGYRYRITRLSM